MSFVNGSQEVANAIGLAQAKNKLTTDQMLLIVGDMLHILMDQKAQESKDGTEDLVHGGHPLRARPDNGDERPAVQAH